jgi:predicted nuclease of predicted toxin-antitoxin system
VRFKIDENLPVEAAQLLRAAGHDAMTVIEQGLSGINDPALSQVCNAESRAIISLDLDFADIRNYPPEAFHGIVVLRLGHEDKDHILAVLAALLATLDVAAIKGQLWIVDEHTVRVRGG